METSRFVPKPWRHSGSVQLDLCYRIHDLMQHHGLNKSQFAASLHVNPDAIYSRMTGVSRWTLEDLYLIARVYRLDLVDLLPPVKGESTAGP